VELAYDAEPERREAASREALTLARGGGSSRALAAALSARHVTLWGPEHTEERLALAREIAELGYRSGDLELALQGRNWCVADLLEAGDGAGVRAELDAYATLSAEVRLPAYAWWVPAWGATLALLEGRLAEGMELSARARELARRAGDPNAVVTTAQHALMRRVIEDRFDDVDPRAMGLERTVIERAESGPAWRAYRLTFAWIHAERGERDAARALLDGALDGGLEAVPRDANWLVAMHSATCACTLLGDVALAARIREALAPFADRMVIAARGGAHAGSVSYALARLSVTCGDLAAAERHFEEAIRRDGLAGAPVWVARDTRGRERLYDDCSSLRSSASRIASRPKRNSVS
jgi:hypothetical protein